MLIARERRVWRNKKAKQIIADNFNRHRPIRGALKTVHPIINNEDIQKIKDMLRRQKSIRDYALFVIGINTALRVSDLVRIRVAHVIDILPMETISIRERKTKKVRHVYINNTCYDTIRLLLKEIKEKNLLDNERYIFYSRIFQRQPITEDRVYRMVKGWCKAIGLRGNYGSHTLRKTWGYHQRVDFGVDMPTLMKCFGHSSQDITMRYLCIQPEEVKNAFEHEL